LKPCRDSGDTSRIEITRESSSARYVVAVDVGGFPTRSEILMRSRIIAAASAAIILFALSCFDQQLDTSAPTGPLAAKGGAKLKSITVTPQTSSIAIGQGVQLTAQATPGNVSPSYTWTSSNTSVATVSQSGLVSGAGVGSATITASASGISGTATVTVSSASTDPVLVGAGDIASCSSSGDEATATLLDAISGTVFTLGDNAYESGSASEYTNCYGPSWGRHRARTRPTPGNHEYNTANAAGYYGYFGTLAGDATKGYYSYNLGQWHIIVLNSNSDCGTISCAAGSAQEQWLRADLAANPTACTLAYWHHPRFNSGAEHGNDLNVAPLWQALYDFHADVILNGHEHVYERFAPQNPSGVADATGIRQFTVGTGGKNHYPLGTIQPNSQIQNATTYGVLKLTLHASSYDWQFVPVAGGSFTDSGTGSCH
jgi:hypothetical protein